MLTGEVMFKVFSDVKSCSPLRNHLMFPPEVIAAGDQMKCTIIVPGLNIVGNICGKVNTQQQNIQLLLFLNVLMRKCDISLRRLP